MLSDSFPLESLMKSIKEGALATERWTGSQENPCLVSATNYLRETELSLPLLWCSLPNVVSA